MYLNRVVIRSGESSQVILCKFHRDLTILEKSAKIGNRAKKMAYKTRWAGGIVPFQGSPSKHFEKNAVHYKRTENFSRQISFQASIFEKNASTRHA